MKKHIYYFFLLLLASNSICIKKDPPFRNADANNGKEQQLVDLLDQNAPGPVDQTAGEQLVNIPNPNAGSILSLESNNSLLSSSKDANLLSIIAGSGVPQQEQVLDNNDNPEVNCYIQS